MILTACSASQQLSRLDSAAAQVGAQRAGDNLPDWPAYCRDLMPKVEPKLDEPIYGTQKRWEIVRENENDRIEWCASHYDKLQKARRAGGQQKNDAT
ncbi:hypothetical protein [Rhizobium leguminosarum]|uniref:hypothetical protein n=1 Tax=Rhizobium leguminosarum TaxID=384 RepID=UPI001C91C0F7|nr:hypothetical protein [Rhizobium leguminosarum]MBY2932511.1 hypothetical protein [Rhizobium leguminosarum]